MALLELQLQIGACDGAVRPSIEFTTLPKTQLCPSGTKRE